MQAGRLVWTILRNAVGAFLLITTLTGVPNDIPTWRICIFGPIKDCPPKVLAIVQMDLSSLAAFYNAAIVWRTVTILFALLLLTPPSVWGRGWTLICGRWRREPQELPGEKSPPPNEAEAPPTEVAPPPSPDAPIIESGDGFEFYPDRNQIPDTRRTRTQLERAKDEIWASWNTGQIVLRGDMLRIPNRKRILLLHPEKIGPYLSALEGTPLDTLKGQIEGLTRLAWKTAEEELLDVQVRWLTRMPRNTVMLLDPRRENGWAYVELLQPGVPEDLRPGIWFTKSRFPTFYARLVDAFENQWRHESVDPTWKSDHEVVGDQVRFSLTARRRMQIQGVRMVVTAPDTPDGALLRQAEQYWPSELQEGGTVSFIYPRQFEGAIGTRSGEWTARWSVVISGNWREAIREVHDICMS